MASWAINQQTAPDTFDTSSTLDKLPVLDHINIDVVNQGIYWQVKQAGAMDPSGLSGVWNPPVYMLPGSRTLQRAGMVGFRFYAATPAAKLPAGSSQAVVTVECVES